MRMISHFKLLSTSAYLPKQLNYMVRTISVVQIRCQFKYDRHTNQSSVSKQSLQSFKWRRETMYEFISKVKNGRYGGRH